MPSKLSDQRGSGSIELLALVPLFILIAMMVWQFAVAGYGVLNTQAAARDGVRVAAAHLEEDLDQARVKAREAAEKSFGTDNAYYTLDDVNVDFPGSEAQVIVKVSIHLVLLPGNVTFPYSWTVTAPRYSDKAQVDVT